MVIVIVRLLLFYLGLLASFWFKVIRIVVYILNRIPRLELVKKSLIDVFYSWLRGNRVIVYRHYSEDIRLKIAHLKVFRYKAYLFTNNTLTKRARTDLKVSAQAYIG